MRNLILGLASLIATTFVGVAHADELSDRFVAACVANGDSAAACTCAGGAMQATFSEAQFTQVVTALEMGGEDAVSDAIESILGTNPGLIPVFKSEMAACG